MLNSMVAQLPCLSVSTNCLTGINGVGDGSDFKCIDANESNISSSVQNAISAGLLLPAAQSANTAQKVVIRGTLNVDVSNYTFASGSIIVLSSQIANQATEIIVPSGNKLTITSSTVTGYNIMWRRILVQQGGELIVSNSTIKDGGHSPTGERTAAVEAEQGSSVQIIGNAFRQNSRSVLIGTSNTVGSVSGLVQGNSFDGADNLKTPFTTIRPREGVRVDNI
jgi:hypothetical protein